MNNKTRKIIIFGLLIIALFIFYKYLCYNWYGPDNFFKLSDVKITGNMTTKHVELTDNEAITFNEMRFMNVFDGYKRFNEETDTYKMVTENEDKAIFIGSEKQYVYTISDSKEYKFLYKSVIKKENIQDDLDFVKYMEKHNDDEVSFFMPLFKQKRIYSVNEFKALMLPSIQYVKTIDGYYRGYIFKTSKDVTEVNLLISDKKYYMTFFGDYTEEFINDFVNSFEIER